MDCYECFDENDHYDTNWPGGWYAVGTEWHGCVDGFGPCMVVHGMCGVAMEDLRRVQTLVADFADHEAGLAELRVLIKSSSGKLFLNDDRKALQLSSCDGTSVIAHIPLPHAAWVALADATMGARATRAAL